MDSATYDRLSTLYQERVAAQDIERPGYQQRWDALTARVLSHGGDLVVPPLEHEVHLDMLTERLTAWPGEGAKMRRGRPNRCHGNSAGLWLSEKAASIATGYALSDDGLWRQHSWAFDAKGRILETTELRDQYAGVLLTDVEAVVFAAANVAEAEFEAALRAGGRVSQIARSLLEGAREDRADHRAVEEGSVDLREEPGSAGGAA